MNTLAKLAVGLGAAATAASFSMYNVDGGQRVIIFDRFSGVQKKSVGEGTHFLIPGLQTPYYFDVRTRPRRVETLTGSKDMQMVKITLRILHRPDVEHLSEIYQSYGLDYDERILPSIGNEILKATIAQFDATELITQRELISMKIREELVRRAKHFNLLLEDISIVDLTFGREFTQAVEQKQVAQQEAERAKFTVEKAEQEKLAAIIRAEGESSAAVLISQALKESGQGLIELRRIEAAKDIAQTLSSSRNITYLPGGEKGSNQTLLLNVGN